MRNPDVIVTGVGRSGTSTTSRILHSKLKVCMGHEFHKPAQFSPNGSFEDVRMVGVGQRITGGFPFPEGPRRLTPITAQEWVKQFKRNHRNCTNKLIGVKSPHLSGCTVGDWAVINPRIIFRTWRPKKLVLASMMKWRDPGLDWERFIDEREANMDAVFKHSPVPVVTILFDQHVSDASLEQEITHYLKDAGLT